MKKDFITATPDSGGSGSTTVTAAASANQTESARSVSLSVAGGGMTRTVGASQAAGVVTWNYYFSVTPTSLSFVAGGESKSVTVTSYRKKVINGVETSTQENVTYTVAVTGTGFSGSGTTVTAAANSSTSTRTGTATYTQTTSGKSQGVSLSQAARIPRTFTITFYGGNKGEDYYLFNSPATPSSGPIKYTKIKMDSDNYQGTVSWNEDDGLELNFNAGAPSNKDYVFPGDSYSIIATTEFNSWNNCRTGTYTVEAGNPTVGLP